jgi:hypothetical protein
VNLFSSRQESFDNRRGAQRDCCAKFLAAQGAVVALNDQKPLEKWTPEALGVERLGVGFSG